MLQLLEWFKRYQSVIQKEEVGILLKSERQNFANLLYDFVNDLSAIDFTSRNAVLKKFPPEIINLPEIILKIMWIKEISDKVGFLCVFFLLRFMCFKVFFIVDFLFTSS